MFAKYHMHNQKKTMHRILPVWCLDTPKWTTRDLQVYKSYIQPHWDGGITLYDNSTQKTIDLFQGARNHAARLIIRNFDYINYRGIDVVKCLMHGYDTNGTDLMTFGPFY